MNDVLKDVIGKFVLVYLDEIVIHTVTGKKRTCYISKL